MNSWLTHCNISTLISLALLGLILQACASGEPEAVVEPAALSEATQVTPTQIIFTPTPSPTLTPVPPTAMPTRSPTPNPTATATPRSTTAPPTPTPTTTTESESANNGVVIHRFEAAPTTLEAGGDITLTWSAEGEQAIIYPLDYQGRLTETNYEVPLSGELVLSPGPGLSNKAEFVLYVIAGEVVEQASVAVDLGCAESWFFTEPPADCPYPPQQTRILFQKFEHGLMFWLAAPTGQEINDVYILFDDDIFSPRWQLVTGNWAPGMPENDPGLQPPPGYLQPQRGLGAVWREQSNIRERLGWATESEQAIEDGALQCVADLYSACFLSGPDGQVYILEPERSGWSLWQQ